MVDTDDTRRTTDDSRRTTDDGRRTTPGVWHKLPTGELKTVPEKHIIYFSGLECILLLLLCTNTYILNLFIPKYKSPIQFYHIKHVSINVDKFN